MATPTSRESDFPSEYLENCFASLATRAGSGGANGSRSGTPSRQ